MPVKIEPFGIVFLDQLDLPLPLPSLEYCLALDRFDGGWKGLDMNEPEDAVFLREAVGRSGTMLMDASAMSLVTPI